MKFQDIMNEGKKLRIRTFPDPVLKKVAPEVTEFNDELKTLCKDMLHTMYKAPGIGLAAPQVGVSLRIFVMDIDYDREKTTLPNGESSYIITNTNPLIFINPKIKNKQDKTTYEEGCLSLPGVYEEIERFKTITVEYHTPEGELKTIDADELLSICIQHENDHLDGIVMLDKMGPVKKNFYAQKLVKQKKKQQKISKQI